nr:hypothetical protein [Tanacetum cinerariifolium]
MIKDKCDVGLVVMESSWTKLEKQDESSSVIAKEHDVIYVIDDEETLILEEKSRSKMLHKQNDPISRTTSNAISAGAWGFEHTKACFLTEIIPFLKVLKDTFNAFDKTLLDEIIEVQTIFNQIEAAVDQCYVDKNTFEIEKKELKLENERLLVYIICQDVVNIVMHADVKFDNVLPMPNTFLDDNIALDVMKMENDHLMELLVYQDLVHTAVNSLDVIKEYQSMERNYIKEYEKNLKLAAEVS